MDADGLNFIASIFASLTGLLASCAWPTAIILIVLVLRRQIASAFPNLTRLKAAGMEFEFAEGLEKAEREADQADIPSVDDAPEELLGPDFAWLYRLAQLNPRSAIVEAWLHVENSVAEVAAQADMEMGPPKSPYTILRQLKSDLSYSPQLISLIDDLRRLRNKAVHEIDFSPGLDETTEYIALALRASNALRRAAE